MIIQNGWIEFITMSGGYFDATTGHPISAIEEYSELIPCQYRPTNYNSLARADGEAHTLAHYEVLIESLWGGTITDRLRLTDKNGHDVGSFSVIKTEPLDAVCEYKISI